MVKWRQGEAPRTMAYDAASRLTTSAFGSLITTFAYEQTGNLISQNENGVRTTYTYDLENQLRFANANGAVSTYRYGPDGLRHDAQEFGGPLTTFVWDGTDLLGEY